MEISNVKYCFVASAGGHLSELLTLLSFDSFLDKSSIFISTSGAVQTKLNKYGLPRIVVETNRQHPFKTLISAYMCLKIIHHYKPKYVISTGAAVGCLCCFWGKLFGAKVIWIDSIANIKKLSLSGRMIRPFADLILSQWPEVAKKYPKVEYAGELI